VSITVLIIIAAYLVGSIPIAYLVTHGVTGKDLRREGSGNIGTRNAFEVTNSKKIGATVLILDLLKGLLPVLLLYKLHYTEYIPVTISALVIGHCYPLWLRFHGGRGLAPSAGILLAVQPFALVIWLQVYFLSSAVKKNVHLNATIAIIASAFVIAILPADYFYSALGLEPDANPILFSLRSGLLIIILVILSRHIGPLKEYFGAKPS